jgi:hypothetical protein
MSSNIFTKEDEILLDFLVGYRIIFNYIQNESMKNTLNLTSDNVIPHFSKVQLIVNDTKKEETVSMCPLGDLIGNTFYWFHPNIRALFFDTADAFIKRFKINKTMGNTMLKFFKDDKIEFSEKYRDSIPCFVSIMLVQHPPKARIHAGLSLCNSLLQSRIRRLVANTLVSGWFSAPCSRPLCHL